MADNNINNDEMYNVSSRTAVNIFEENRPNTPTPPANFAELFANIEQCSNTVLQDESGKEDELAVMNGAICDYDENNISQLDDENHSAMEYDPVNFQIDKYSEDEVNSKYFDKNYMNCTIQKLSKKRC